MHVIEQNKLLIITYYASGYVTKVASVRVHTHGTNTRIHILRQQCCWKLLGRFGRQLGSHWVPQILLDMKNMITSMNTVIR